MIIDFFICYFFSTIIEAELIKSHRNFSDMNRKLNLIYIYSKNTAIFKIYRFLNISTAR